MKITTSIVAFAAISTADAEAAADSNYYTVGIVPQQSASRLAKIWVPALAAWGQEAGYGLKFATAKDIPTFEACLAKGAYDFAYMNPYHYTVFHALSGYEAFARQKDKKLKGIIVAHRKSDIENLEDLNNTELAFPSPAAFGASVIPRAELKKMGVTFDPKYVHSHDSVYRAVSSGLMPAGGGVIRTFKTVAEDIRANLKVIYETDAYTPHAFAAHYSVPKHIVTAVSRAMKDSAVTNPRILKPLGMSGIESADNEAWDDVRALNLGEKQTDIVKDSSLQCHSD